MHVLSWTIWVLLLVAVTGQFIAGLFLPCFLLWKLATDRRGY